MSRSTINRMLSDFIAQRDSIYVATASVDGQPYVQHRGGSKGFIKILNDKTIAFADFEGNRQYITVGNLKHNPKAFIFMMDYARRRRIKLWGRAHVKFVEGQRTIVFEIERWDINCPQYIPQKYGLEEIEGLVRAGQVTVR